MYSDYKKKIKRVLFLYNIFFLIIVSIFYFVIPILLSYPPNSINNNFERMIDMGFTYRQQYIAIVIIGMLSSNILLLTNLKKISGWTQISESDDEENYIKKKKIIYTCFTAPGKLYIIHVFIPVITIFIGLIITGANVSLAIKISVCMLAVFMVLGLLIYVLSKHILTYVLTELKNDLALKIKFDVIGKYRKKILVQFLPLSILMGTLIYLVTTSLYSFDKSELLFEKYYSKLEEVNLESIYTIEEIKLELQKIEKISNKDTLFIIDEQQVIYQDNNDVISDFFIKYIYNVDNNNHAYGYYASDIQGVYKFIDINGEKYAVGIMYYVFAIENTLPIVITFLILLGVILAFLLFFAKDFSDPINQISNYMKRLTAGKSIDYDQKIPVTSNDELGELTVNFNKILDLEKNYVTEIEHNKEALIESERLSSLGQLIGGVAHNLKTPIMSISGNLQGLQDLITEYDASIGDDEVTNEDHKDIAKDMQELVDKTRIHLSYMSDVITAVKGQAVQLDSSQEQIFSATEVVSRIEILMRHELKNALVEMKSTISDDAKVAYIKGDINSLVQVLNNFIQNSIYAYKGKSNQTIYLDVTKNENKLCFKIQDYGCGIPDNVKEKLFKEMVTTKGKNGTGLGLYMSYSTIKGKFGGGLEFESEVGKGTTFYITIPIAE